MSQPLTAYGVHGQLPVGGASAAQKRGFNAVVCACVLRATGARTFHAPHGHLRHACLLECAHDCRHRRQEHVRHQPRVHPRMHRLWRWRRAAGFRLEVTESGVEVLPQAKRGVGQLRGTPRRELLVGERALRLQCRVHPQEDVHKHRVQSVQPPHGDGLRRRCRRRRRRHHESAPLQALARARPGHASVPRGPMRVSSMCSAVCFACWCCAARLHGTQSAVPRALRVGRTSRNVHLPCTPRRLERASIEGAVRADDSNPLCNPLRTHSIHAGALKCLLLATKAATSEPRVRVACSGRSGHNF